MMKQITFVCMIAMMLCTTLAEAGNRIVTERDSLGNKKRAIELQDTVVNGKTISDTLSITTYEGTGTSTDEEDVQEYSYEGSKWHFVDAVSAGVLVPIVAITACFGMPVLLIFLIFFFRYKNRKAKYRMAEQILASGQPLPENFFATVQTKDARSKGISNTFLGIGLFIFLWAITNEFSIGCIGLLITCIGLGQIIIYYTQEKKEEDKKGIKETKEIEL